MPPGTKIVVRGLREAELSGTHAVDVEMQVGCVDYLMHVYVDRAGDGRDALKQAAGDLVVGRIVSLHLHVDRCRQSEVEDLA